MQREASLFMASNFIQTSVTQLVLAPVRERWVDGITRMIHHVLVLCDPQLFIVRCSIKQA